MITNLKKQKLDEQIEMVEFETQDLASLNVYAGGDYIRKGLCRVSELEHEEVGRVLVINRSNHYLLFTDMDILTGAKQNRTVNMTTLVRPNSKSILEVSCVEQSRWENFDDCFGVSEDIMEPDMRKKKVERICNDPEKYQPGLQSVIWDSISKRIEDTGEDNPTLDYHQHLSTLNKADNRHFPEPWEQANGVAFFYESEITHLETFGNPFLYRYYFPGILRNFSCISSTDFKPRVKTPIEQINAWMDFRGARRQLTNPQNACGEIELLEWEDRNGFEFRFGDEGLHYMVMG